MVICGASRRFLKLFLVTTPTREGVGVLQMVSGATHDCELCQWMEDPWAVTLAGQRCNAQNVHKSLFAILSLVFPIRHDNPNDLVLSPPSKDKALLART